MSLTPGLVKKVMTFLEDVLKDSDLLKAGDDGGTDTFGPVKDFHLDRQTVRSHLLLPCTSLHVTLDDIKTHGILGHPRQSTLRYRSRPNR